MTEENKPNNTETTRELPKGFIDNMLTAKQEILEILNDGVLCEVDEYRPVIRSKELNIFLTSYKLDPNYGYDIALLRGYSQEETIKIINCLKEIQDDRGK